LQSRLDGLFAEPSPSETLRCTHATTEALHERRGPVGLWRELVERRVDLLGLDPVPFQIVADRGVTTAASGEYGRPRACETSVVDDADALEPVDGSAPLRRSDAPGLEPLLEEPSRQIASTERSSGEVARFNAPQLATQNPRAVQLGPGREQRSHHCLGGNDPPLSAVQLDRDLTAADRSQPGHPRHRRYALTATSSGVSGACSPGGFVSTTVGSSRAETT
jgi:hypothetical protein